MNDIDILNQMIKNKARVSVEPSNGKFKVTLEEPQHPENIVTIVDIPHDVIVIKADAFQSLGYFFLCKKGECKRADFIIINESKKAILFIEMKKMKDLEKEIIQQLKGAYCLLSYCQEIGKAFWEKSNFLDKYAHRFISIGHISTNKRKTRIDRYTTGIHDRPDRMMKIHWPNKRIEFNLLVGAKKKSL